MLKLFFFLFLLFSFIFCYDFQIGSVNDPVPNKELASLYQLQNNQEYQERFISQYNNDGGLAISYIYISYCCLLVQEGTLFYSPIGSSELLFPYKNGFDDCASHLSGTVQIGISVNYGYYATLNSSVILNEWGADFSQGCSQYNTYSIYGPSFSSGSYSPVPSYSSAASYSPTSSISLSTSNFKIGSSINPLSGKQLVSLYDLQNNYEYAELFMNEYNNGGLPIEYISISYCCILVQEGSLFYAPSGNSDLLITFLNGIRACDTYISSNIKFGSLNGEYFDPVTSNTILSWDADFSSSCSSSNSYALYGPLIYSTSISPSISPSISFYFEIGSISDPVPGKELVSLYYLQNNQNYANQFINQYNNNGGLPIEYISVPYCCILVQEGALYYTPGGNNDPIFPYQNGEYDCASFISGIVQFGIGVSENYYTVIYMSDINNWDADYSQSCSNSNSYAIYGPPTASLTPSYTPVQQSQTRTHTPTPTSTPSPSSSILSFDFKVGSVNSPVPGRELVSLYDLQNNNEFAELFINQYNSGGLPIEYISINYCCILVQEGALYYSPGGNTDMIVPFVNGNYYCNTYISQNIYFGTDSSEYFGSMSTSILASFGFSTSQTCVGSNSYALYGPSVQSTPSPSPSPSINHAQDTCCLYFSISQQYESAFCQKPNYQCPEIGTFTAVGNYTVNDCNSCSIVI